MMRSIARFLTATWLGLCPGLLDAALTDGLAAHYRFDETSGITAADSLRGAPGAGGLNNFGANSWRGGRIGGAVELDGANDWITTVDAIPDHATRMSFSGWVWADARPTWASIAKNWGSGASGQFHCGLDSGSGRLSNYLSDGTKVTDPDLFPLGSWQHVAFTYDGAIHRLFRNGIQVASTTTTTTLVRSSQVTALGCKTNDGGTAPDSAAAGHWNGRFDDFGFWTRELSAAEVDQIYHNGKSGLALDDPGVPLISAFTASPLNLPAEGTTTLSWSVTNADRLTLDGGPFAALDVSALTQITTPPLAASVTFTLTASNATGPATAEQPVGVGETLLEPLISEFLASNNTGLRDAAIGGETEDWIEIHNPNALYALDLAGYHLTDNPGLLDKWTFPAVTIPPGGYLVVFASAKDRALPGEPPHTNFKLSAAGEYLALVNPDGATIVQQFAPAYPAQTPDISYGPSGYLATPTPGAANSGAAGPLIAGTTENPPPPAATDALTISATITPRDEAAVASATLIYRVMYGAETSVPMTPGAAGLFTAVIPAAVAAPGQMLRWRITASDSAARSSRVPLFPDPTNSPEYFGTIVADPTLSSLLPIIHRFVQNPAGINGDPGTRCSLWFDGEFFDNLEIRIRGNTSRSYPKKSHKIEMNSGCHFLFQPGVARVSEFNLNTTHTDKSYVRAILASEMQRTLGMVSPQTFAVQVRQNGGFYSVVLFTENPDDDLLKRYGLDPAGAYYKAPGNNTYASSASFEKKTRLDEPGKADLDALIAGLGLTGTELETYVFDHVDLPVMIDYIATTCITQNIDASDKNHFAYRDTNGSGEWSMQPWDLDLTFGPNALNTDTIVYQQKYASHPFIGATPYLLSPTKNNRFLEAIINTPRAREMVLRRIRSLMDQFLATNWFQDRIDQLVPLLDAEVALDHAKWGSASHFGGLTHTLSAANNRIKTEYLAPRATWLDGGGSVGIPAAQPEVTRIEFGAYDANPGSGDQDQEFIELVNSNTYAADLSGWMIGGGISHKLRPGTVIPAGSSLYLTPSPAAFRSRGSGPGGGQKLFVQATTSGHLSNFGEALVLRNPAGVMVASLVVPPAPSDPQRFLVVSEIMYQPAPDANAEYLELINTSAEVTLDLSGVSFSTGISFTFAEGTTLAPCARTLVVKSLASFVAVHGAGMPLAGEFANLTSLNNGGERIKLDDASGSTISEFTYDDVAPWPLQAKGGGSLVLIAPLTHPDPALPLNWRVSMTPNGNPGTDDAIHFSGDPAGDIDGDGWSNLLEYAFGNSPVMVATLTPDGLVLSVPHIANADDAVVAAEVSTDLVNWFPAERSGPSGADLTFRTPARYASAPRLFIRAAASLRGPP